MAANIRTAYQVEAEVIYFPQLGYLISVASGEFVRAGMDWVFQFESHTGSYYKNPTMHGKRANNQELDTSVGDVHSMIVDLELKHLQNLREQVLNISEIFSQVSAVLAEIDCLASFAECSIENKYVRPEIHDSSLPLSVQILDGRYNLK